MTIHIHKGDLPDTFDPGSVVAVDTETLGLNPYRDRLCVVQLSCGDGEAHLVQLGENDYAGADTLRAVLSDPKVEKIFHFARFDMAVLKRYLGVDVTPVFCTKIASRLVRTYTDRHGLKDLVRELLGLDLDKKQQSSDWASALLSEEQKAYAAADVLYLHDIRAKLAAMLEREGRTDIAAACFAFLPVRAQLDLMGWPDDDIFAHS